MAAGSGFPWTNAPPSGNQAEAVVVKDPATTQTSPTARG